MLHTILYISNTSEDLTKAGLDAIFNSTQSNNSENGITGVLLHFERNFLQVLEGDSTILEPLFKTIRQDPRHKNIFIILDKKIEDRIFENYRSGFSILKNKSDLENLKQYLTDADATIPRSKNIAGVLEPFLL